jgi:transcriptional regulator with XRE-family HTH domain
MKKHYGRVLQSARIAKGYTQCILGEKVKITKQMISNFESQRTAPNLEMLIRLSKHININVKELYGPEIYNVIEDIQKQSKDNFLSRLPYFYKELIFEAAKLNDEQQSSLLTFIKQFSSQNVYTWCLVFKLEALKFNSLIAAINDLEDFNNIFFGSPHGNKNNKDLLGVKVNVPYDLDEVIKCKLEPILQQFDASLDILTKYKSKLFSQRGLSHRLWEKNFTMLEHN